MNIREIENMTEKEVAEKVIEKMDIKGFNVYLINFDDAFGYSALVFKNDHYIHYANDYELHHKYLVEEEGIEGLRKYYIESLNNKLYTEEELDQPLKNYDEYDKKSYFLHNYYGMQVDYISIFHIFHNKEEEMEYDKKVKTMHYNPVGLCYMHDIDFIKKHMTLFNKLRKRKEAMKDDFEYQKGAFLSEMYNHEYGINWEADYSVLSTFGNIEYHGDEAGELEKYFEELSFTDTQRNAYFAARTEYYRKQSA